MSFSHIFAKSILSNLPEFQSFSHLSVYKSMSFRLVSEVSSTIKAIVPVNGYLMYQSGVSAQQIFMQTVDNSVTEQEASYSIKLIGLTGDGRMGTAINSRVTSELSLIVYFACAIYYIKCLSRVSSLFCLYLRSITIKIKFNVYYRLLCFQLLARR